MPPPPQLGQDWNEVILTKRPQTGGKGGKGAKPAPADGTNKFVSRTSAYTSAGGKTLNQQFTTAVSNHKKLDEDTENLKHKTLTRDFQITLQQARTSKGWNRKELANACQERETVIAEYENGKAIPNNQLIAKMERVLGIHLRGKDAGQPIQKPVPKAAKPAAKQSKK